MALSDWTSVVSETTGTEYATSLGDASDLADSVTRGADRYLNDLAELVDAIERAGVFARSVSDMDSLVDRLLRDPIDFAQTMSDTDLLADLIGVEAAASLQRTLGDPGTRTQSGDTRYDLRDALDLADTRTRQWTFGRTRQDVVTLADSMATSIGGLTAYGPTAGAQAVRDGAGPQIAVTEPGGPHTTLNPAASQATTQAAITAAGVGATIWWPAGRYYLTSGGSYFPQSNQTWLLQTPARGTKKTEANTAVLTRGEAVTGWTAGTGADTGLWWKAGQTQDFGDGAPRSGVVADAFRSLFYTEREDYWKDKDEQGAGTLNTATHLWPVAAKADLFGGAGRPPVGQARYFDHAASTVWIGFNPSGHTVHRTANGDFNSAFILATSGGKHDVLIRGGIFEMAPGTIASMSYGEGLEHDITFEHMTMRYCNRIVLTAWGDFTDPQNQIFPYNMVVRNCYIGWGGQYAEAMARVGSTVFERNEIAYGNFGPGAAHAIDDEGVQKWGGCPTGQTCEWNYNWVHDSNAQIWWDTKAGILHFAENVIENNAMGYAVMLEDIADNPVIFEHNLLKDNGYKHAWARCSHGWGTYHVPEVSWMSTNGQLRMNATNNVEIRNNWFQTLTTDTTHGQHEDIEPGWQSRATGLGPRNTWIHHNRFDRKMRLGVGFSDYVYRGFHSADTGSACHPYAAADNYKLDFNEYHVPAGLASATDWFNRGGTNDITFTEWRAGMASSCGGLGSPASYFDPHSTLVADL